MKINNKMTIEFESRSINEALARTVVAAFVAPLDPTMEELADIRTAISEAVTNAIIHGYVDEIGIIKISCQIKGHTLIVEVMDNGKGIKDLKQAMEPLYTSKPELERSGMGFTFMEVFMDDLKVISTPGIGTYVTMQKKVGTSNNALEYTQEIKENVN